MWGTIAAISGQVKQFGNEEPDDELFQSIMFLYVYIAISPISSG
jgi:hypothetical protein